MRNLNSRVHGNSRGSFITAVSCLPVFNKYRISNRKLRVISIGYRCGDESSTVKGRANVRRKQRLTRVKFRKKRGQIKKKSVTINKILKSSYRQLNRVMSMFYTRYRTKNWNKFSCCSPVRVVPGQFP